jgi:hypothetical protein
MIRFTGLAEWERFKAASVKSSGKFYLALPFLQIEPTVSLL